MRLGSVSVLCLLLTLFVGTIFAQQGTIYSCGEDYSEDNKDYVVMIDDLFMSGTVPCLTISGNGNNINFMGAAVHAATETEFPPVGILVTGNNNVIISAICINCRLVIEGQGTTLQGQAGFSGYTGGTGYTGSSLVAAVTIRADNVITDELFYNSWQAPNFIGLLVENSTTVTTQVKIDTSYQDFATFTGVYVQNSKNVEVLYTFQSSARANNYVGVAVFSSDETSVSATGLSVSTNSSYYGIQISGSNNTRVSSTNIINQESTGDLSGIVVYNSTSTTIYEVTMEISRSSNGAFYGINITNSPLTVINASTLNLAAGFGVYSSGASSNITVLSTAILMSALGTGMHLEGGMTFASVNITGTTTRVNAATFPSLCSSTEFNLCFPVKSSGGFACCDDTCQPKNFNATCRESRGACDKVEVCDGGSPSCPDDELQGSGFKCNSSASACGSDTYCNGADSCPPAIPACDEAPATACNAATKTCYCEVPEFSSFYPNCGEGCQSCTTGKCNATTGECTTSTCLLNEDCGVNSICNSGQCKCSQDGYAYPYCNKCTPGSCLSGTCDPSTGFCQCANISNIYPRCNGASCGDGFCDPGEENILSCVADCYNCTTKQDCIPGSACCDSDCGFSSTARSCDISSGACELTAYCNGSSPVCPAKRLRPNTYVCRNRTLPCESDVRCAGGVICPVVATPEVSGYICNRSDDACFPSAKCDGFNKTCPPIVQRSCYAFCGDGKCDAGETCSNCLSDCGACETPACPGTPPCSGRGDCRSGVCFCPEGYTGAKCSDVSVPVVIVHNTTTTTIVVPTPGSNNNQTGNEDTVTFRVGITRIYEKTTNDVIVIEYTLAGRDFNATYENLTTSERYNTTIRLPNNAIIEYSSWIFYEGQNVSFADLSIPVTNYTVKNIVDVKSWNFETLSNRLVIEYELELDTVSDCTSSNLQQDANNNLYYFTIKSGAVSLYCQLVDTIIVDNRLTKAQFLINDTNKLQVITPHFWDNLVVDPNFAVLLGDDNDDYNTPDSNKCGENQTGDSGDSGFDPILVAIIVAPVVGVLILVILFASVVYPRLSTWYQLKRGAQHMVDRDMDEISQREPVIEKMPDLDITTAAGRFVVKM